jgi:hypothetical protein
MMWCNDECRVKLEKIIWPVLILVLCFGGLARADVVTFVGSDCQVDLRVQDVTENLLTGVIKRADIKRLQVGVSSDDLLSDRLLIRDCSDEFKVKMVSMSEEWVILVLPKDIIATFELGSTPETPSNAPVSQDVKPGAQQAEVAPPGRELKTSKARTGDMEGGVESDVLKILFGSLRGRMLANGKPYAGCKVKLRLLKPSYLNRIFTGKRDDTGPQLFEATTDDQGVYRLERLPEGAYDIFWIPPGRDYWVRLFKKGPGVVIHAGAEVVQPDINADMRVVGK